MRRVVVLALAALLCATAAQARPKYVLAMVRVEAGDLDLATAAGAAAMIRRLDQAASELCAAPRSPLLPGREGRAWRCRTQAVASAVERMQTPALAAAHHAWLSAEPDADPQARNPG
jgi:UrcA family protein